MSNNTLRTLLDESIENHKSDIRQIARSTVLNRIELDKNQTDARWKSIKSSEISETKKKKKASKNLSHEESFNTRMVAFALGAGAVTDAKTTVIDKPKRVKLLALDDKCEVSNLVTQSLSSNIPKSSDVVPLVHCSPERYGFSSPRYPRRDQIVDNNDNRNTNLIPHYIHPRYKTQYEQLLRFREENIRENDQKEQNILTGTNLIYHLEMRLQKKLDALVIDGKVPSFKRLQVFNDIFNDLISESWMFAPLLIRIKSSYDDEVNRLLEAPITQKELLSSEIEELKSSIFKKEKLQNLQSEVLQLDEAIQVCLESDKSFASLLLEEEQKLDQLIKEKAQFDEEEKKRYRPKHKATAPTESEKLELLKVQCWDLMDDISKCQKETKQNMVPRATISHLSEGLQDIGIEVEKLNYHKKQLLTETAEMKEELYRYIVEEEMRGDDFRLIETILCSPSPLSVADYEESSKWSWYIS